MVMVVCGCGGCAGWGGGGGGGGREKQLIDMGGGSVSTVLRKYSKSSLSAMAKSS